MKIQIVKYGTEEYYNALTHGIGIILALIGAPILLYYAWNNGNQLQFNAAVIYSIATLLVYVCSTLYHASPQGRLKEKFHLMDHLSIYLMIAGTHTPFAIFFLDGQTENIFLAVVWLLAILGIFYKVFYFGKYPLFSLAFYLALGWMGMILLPFLVNELPFKIIALMVAGGFAYSIGIIFFRWKNLEYHHSIWHIFVLIGSFTHYLAICYLFT